MANIACRLQQHRYTVRRECLDIGMLGESVVYLEGKGRAGRVAKSLNWISSRQ